MLTYQRRQDVVVAEADSHLLVGADRVVFVDDRNRAEFVNRVNGVPQVQKSRAVIDVFALWPGCSPSRS